MSLKSSGVLATGTHTAKKRHSGPTVPAEFLNDGAGFEIVTKWNLQRLDKIDGEACASLPLLVDKYLDAVIKKEQASEIECIEEILDHLVRAGRKFNLGEVDKKHLRHILSIAFEILVRNSKHKNISDSLLINTRVNALCGNKRIRAEMDVAIGEYLNTRLNSRYGNLRIKDFTRSEIW